MVTAILANSVSQGTGSPELRTCLEAQRAAVAGLLPAHTAAAAAHFLRRVVLPLYRRAGWRLRRVLTDGGPEFKGAFDETCRALGLSNFADLEASALPGGFGLEGCRRLTRSE